MKEATKMPSRAEIFNYWKYYLDRQGLDWCEPVCWACGEFPWGDKFDIHNHATLDEIAKNWNRIHRLQRCHIVARSLGGSNTPDNLFLMCVECHDLAPNTRSKELFLRWAGNQKNRRMKQIEHTIKSFQLSEEECTEINAVLFDIVVSHNFKQWLLKNTTLHRDQQGRGTRFTLSTFVASCIEYCQLNKNKMID